jgi:hypothetical protein
MLELEEHEFDHFILSRQLHFGVGMAYSLWLVAELVV